MHVGEGGQNSINYQECIWTKSRSILHWADK